MCSSDLADGANACELITHSSVPRSIFYDMDAPVTLSRLARGESVEYIPSEGLSSFDLVLSYTGGETLRELRGRLHAQRVAPLYGWVDPNIHHPVDPVAEYTSDLSYLGTYAADRQRALEDLLLIPARQMKQKRFLIGGAMYSTTDQWPANVAYRAHVPPAQHAAFYCSSRLTLNITRGTMAAMGYCPSGRLFEAAACGTPVLSDRWEGLNEFFAPGEEILIATSTAEALTSIEADSGSLRKVGLRARERALACHTAEIRARQLISLIESSAKESAQIEQSSFACEEA